MASRYAQDRGRSFCCVLNINTKLWIMVLIFSQPTIDGDRQAACGEAVLILWKLYKAETY